MKKFLKSLFVFSLITGLVVACAVLIAGIYFYIDITKDLPRIEKLSDYEPKAVTTVYGEDGAVLAELYDERRYPVEFTKIPMVVRNAFLAAEDSNFYNHPGIDFLSILRAVWVNFQRKGSAQGASTITQQIVKSLLLSREKTYERKVKEAILSYRLEQALSKDEIFSIYLNEIFLGATSYGVVAAGRVHFHKELEELTIAEAAYLAGLPQKPTFYADPKNRPVALQRQRYVLNQLLRNNMISRAEYDAALAEKFTIYPPDNARIKQIPYYTSHAIKVLEEELKRVDPNLTAVNPGGLQVFTTGEVAVNELASRVLRKGLREVDKRRGWRGPLRDEAAERALAIARAERLGEKSEFVPGEVYPAEVIALEGTRVKVEVSGKPGAVDLQKAIWARRIRDEKDSVRSGSPQQLIRVGDIIEVSPLEPTPSEAQVSPVEFQLDQSPDLEGTFVLLNALTGDAKAIVGGYSYARSEFNRATQGTLQPGSAFKPLIYTAAIDVLGYTPATIVPDSPITLVAGNGQYWTPSNYDKKFLGPITFRSALEKSRNVVSVFLLRQIGIDRAIATIRAFGITAPVPRELSISLGTPELQPLELVRAYGVFPAGGYLAETIFVREVRDRHGKVLLQKRPQQKAAISEETAFVMANVMKGVVDRGTATVIKRLGKPVGGKTGTTNNQMDVWFVGFTPEWVAGVWVGFDAKRPIGDKETGGRIAAPIFLEFMEEFLKDTPPIDFDIPNGVIPIPIDIRSGRLVAPDQPGAFIEYFKSGSEPTLTQQDTAIPQEYLTSDEF